MNKQLTKLSVALGTLAVATACQDYDLGYSAREMAYNESFEQTFGKIDPNQDWSFASRVQAQVSVDESASESVVTVYTASPISERSAILFQKECQSVSGLSFAFDAPKTLDLVYVEVKNSDGTTSVSDYFKLENGKLEVSKSSRTRANSSVNLSSATKTTTATNVNNPVSYDVYDFRSQVSRVDGATVMLSDIDEIVGRGRVFNERGHNDVTPQYCNLVEYAKLLNAEKGAEYVMEKDGPIEFDLIYGGTLNRNLLGYFYYSDGTSYADAVKRPHYIVADARPAANVKVDGSLMAHENNVNGMALPGLVTAYDNNPCDATDHRLTGGHYQLTYFGEDGTTGTPSYDFPAGTHVVLFLVQNGESGYTANDLNTKIENSVPAINLADNNKIQQAHNHTNDAEWWELPTGEGHGEIDAVTYNWGGTTILAFEDRDPDQDMNDILLFVKGTFKKTQTEMKVEADAYEWIVACEDLGGTFDYDFNDVVFGVKHYTSKKTLFSQHYENGTLVTDVPKIIDHQNFIIMTPYAAGGSLKTNVYYNNNILGEIHSLLRVDQKTAYDALISGEMPILNATKHVYAGTPVVYQLGNEEVFTMANEPGLTSSGKFSLKTVARNESSDGDNIGSIITAPKAGQAPQMLILPQGWDWPTELTHITTVYPDFASWTESMEANGWIANKTGNYVTNPNKIETTNGSSSTTGGTTEDGKITPIISVSEPVVTLRRAGESKSVTLSIANGNLDNVHIYNSSAGDDQHISLTFTYDAATKTITFTPSSTWIGTSTITVKTPADDTHNEGILQFTVEVIRTIPQFELRQSDGTTVIPENGVIQVQVGATVTVGSYILNTFGDNNHVFASTADASIATCSTNNGYTAFTITGVKTGETQLVVKHDQVDLLEEATKTYTVQVVEASASNDPKPQFTLKIGDTEIAEGGEYEVLERTKIENLNITVIDDKANLNNFQITSSNTSVAAVLYNNVEGTGTYYGHTIQAKDKGETIITVKHTAQANTWSEKSVTFTLKVRQGTGTTANPCFIYDYNKSKEIEIGEVLDIKTIVAKNPYDSPYNSSNNLIGVTIVSGADVVSLNGTTITGLQVGTATLKIKAYADDTYAAAEFDVTVKVVKANLQLTGSALLVENGKSVSNIYTVPADYTGTITGTCSLGTVSGTTFTATEAGTSTIFLSCTETDRYNASTNCGTISVVVYNSKVTTTYPGEGETLGDIQSSIFEGAVRVDFILTGTGGKYVIPADQSAGRWNAKEIYSSATWDGQANATTTSITDSSELIYLKENGLLASNASDLNKLVKVEVIVYK